MSTEESDAKKESSKVDEVKVETPKETALKVDTSKKEENKTETPKVGEAKIETPKVEASKNDSSKKTENDDEYPKKKDVTDFIDHVQTILNFQTSNGLVTSTDAQAIQKEIEDAIKTLKADANQANTLAEKAYFDLVEKINAKGKTGLRLAYMYGIHLWIFLIALTVGLLAVLASQTLKVTVFQDVPADVILWGGLGGIAFSFYHLRQNVYKFQLSKYYGIFWVIYPLAGMIFGLAISIVISAGLLSLQAKPGYTVYAAIAFLAGTFQDWIYNTLKDVAESFHKTLRSS